MTTEQRINERKHRKIMQMQLCKIKISFKGKDKYKPNTVMYEDKIYECDPYSLLKYHSNLWNKTKSTAIIEIEVKEV